MIFVTNGVPYVRAWESLGTRLAGLDIAIIRTNVQGHAHARLHESTAQTRMPRYFVLRTSTSVPSNTVNTIDIANTTDNKVS